MSSMFTPISVKRMRFDAKQRDSSKESYIAVSLEYLLENIISIPDTEKYIMNRNVLVLNVKHDTEKLKTRLAFAGISPDNPILKLNSSNRKPITKVIRGKKGTISGHKRMYLTFSKPFDRSILLNTEEQS